MNNARTGDALKDDDGNAKKFVPNSCRDKCPIRPSTQYNDDDQMKTLMEAVDKDHAA